MNKMKDSLGNELEVGDTAYFANYWTMQVVTITELMENLNAYVVTLPNGNLASAHPEGLILKEKFEATTEYTKYDADGYIIWNGGDRPVDVDTIVAVKVRSGIPRSPVAAKHWPQITWRHRKIDDPMNQWDIVAYKVMK